jgi:hypothetical protein
MAVLLICARLAAWPQIFSLGTVLWEALSGQRPWAGCRAAAVVDSVAHRAARLPLLPSWPVGEPLLSLSLACCLACLAGLWRALARLVHHACVPTCLPCQLSA